jgi:hypothetical protein
MPYADYIKELETTKNSGGRGNPATMNAQQHIQPPLNKLKLVPGKNTAI